jgi:Uma2 family endonuclease
MSAVMSQLITAEEFALLPEPADGSKQELVKGEVIDMSRSQAEHGLVQFKIAWLLMNVVVPNQLGWVLGESGVVVESDPDTLRGPDVFFCSKRNFPERPKGYLKGVPVDLVVEVLSPNDRRADVREKIGESIAAGVPLVWLVDPETQTVMVYSGTMRGVEYGPTDTIDAGTVIPGFSSKVAEFFS